MKTDHAARARVRGWLETLDATESQPQAIVGLQVMADGIERRPRAVPVVAAFLFVATVIAAVVGMSLLFPNRLMDRLGELNKPGAALVYRAKVR